MANRHLHSPDLPTAPRPDRRHHQGDVKKASTWNPHACDRGRCELRGQFAADGTYHFPHKGANCHHEGQDPARCAVHGTFLQVAGGHERGNRYPAPVCYDCLPPHGPECPILITGRWETCVCPARLAALGMIRIKQDGRGLTVGVVVEDLLRNGTDG